MASPELYVDAFLYWHSSIKSPSKFAGQSTTLITGRLVKVKVASKDSTLRGKPNLKTSNCGMCILQL